MVFRTTLTAAIMAYATAFAPPQMVSKTSISLNAAEMSESMPFLTRPEKLDGSMIGDVGFDPMGLSEIQADLKYARWAEIKHGRVCMLAIVGMLWQEYGPHWEGAAYATRDVLAAPGAVGTGVNLQILLGIGVLEMANFNAHYGDDTEPGDYGLDFGFLNNRTPEQVLFLKEAEMKHCRLAMGAFMGAFAQTILFGKLLGEVPGY